MTYRSDAFAKGIGYTRRRRTAPTRVIGNHDRGRSQLLRLSDLGDKTTVASIDHEHKRTREGNITGKELYNGGGGALMISWLWFMVLLCHGTDCLSGHGCTQRIALQIKQGHVHGHISDGSSKQGGHMIVAMGFPFQFRRNLR